MRKGTDQSESSGLDSEAQAPAVQYRSQLIFHRRQVNLASRAFEKDKSEQFSTE